MGTWRTTRLMDLATRLNLTDFCRRYESGGWGNLPCVVCAIHVVV